MANLVIYGSPVSPFVRKVAGLCIEKGVEYEIEAVDIFNPPEWFVEISPARRIPVMRDRSIAEEGPDGTIADSSAICGYIEKKHPEPALYPADPYDHGRALWYEEYSDSLLAMNGGGGMFRPIFFSLLQGKDADVDTARATWNEKVSPIFDYLDRQLEDREYLVGDALSIADISVTTCMMQIALVADMKLDNWSNLAAHYERMTARDSIAGPFEKAERFVRKTMPERISLDQ